MNKQWQRLFFNEKKLNNLGLYNNSLTLKDCPLICSERRRQNLHFVTKAKYFKNPPKFSAKGLLDFCMLTVLFFWIRLCLQWESFSTT